MNYKLFEQQNWKPAIHDSQILGQTNYNKIGSNVVCILFLISQEILIYQVCVSNFRSIIETRARKDKLHCTVIMVSCLNRIFLQHTITEIDDFLLNKNLALYNTV